MIVLHVSVQVKPEHVKEFLEVVRYDAEHSEKDEPGCLRFDLIQDRDDPNRFYFYEVYRDEAAPANAALQNLFRKGPALACGAAGAPLRQEPDSHRRRLALRIRSCASAAFDLPSPCFKSELFPQILKLGAV